RPSSIPSATILSACCATRSRSLGSGCCMGSRSLDRLEQRINRRGAEIAKGAASALAAGPNAIEGALHLVEHHVVVGEHTGLEVATPIALGAEAGAGEVGGAEIE